MKARLTPISSKAKNRLANAMRNNPVVDIEQVDNGKLFFVSACRGYCSWVTFPVSPDWEVQILPASASGVARLIGRLAVQ